MRLHRLECVALLAGVLVTAACSTTKAKRQSLERIAKDWCMTIRASQVLPVYPLTQDLQPGDVFLVQLPIDQQQAIWNDKGFLPLDNHIARLDPSGYSDFYDHSFPLGANDKLPLVHLAGEAWSAAPRAGFPTYGFSVNRGAGLELALPISGVPVGLGLLGSDAAEGTVSIGNARTLGVDTLSLDEDLRHWAGTKSAFLATLGSRPQHKNYLRVVSRVYLTGELDVALRDASQRSGGLDARAPSPIELLTAKTAADPASTAATNVENYETALNRLNELLARQDRLVEQPDGTKKLVPGGSVRFTSATARSITMKETFDPPLVLGYLGFDCEIRPGGVLGPAVPTHAVLDPKFAGADLLTANAVGAAYYASFEMDVYQIVARQDAPEAKARIAELDRLSELVPSTWDVWSRGPDGALTEARRTAESLGDARRTYPAFRQWRASNERSIRALEESLAAPSFTWRRPDGSAVQVAAGDLASQELTNAVAELRRVVSSESVRARHDAAMRAAVDWFVGKLYGAD